MAGRIVEIRPDPAGGWRVTDGVEVRAFATEEQAWAEARRRVADGAYAEVKIHRSGGERTSEFHGDLAPDESAAEISRLALVAQDRVDLARVDLVRPGPRGPGSA